MGFETHFFSLSSNFCSKFELCPYGIWNNYIANHIALVEIWTLSLWDLKREEMEFEKVKEFIWTLSLWDLKR